MSAVPTIGGSRLGDNRTVIDGLLGLFGARVAWMDDAACRYVDPEIFFPEAGRAPKQARKICASCPVAEQCLAWALEHHERWGIWGGVSMHVAYRKSRAVAA